MVGVDGALGGALELRAAERPEAAAIVAGLRARGAKHLAIISGDHEQPTRKLAERLGHGSLLRRGPAAGQGEVRRAAAEGRPHRLLHRRRRERLDRAEEGQRLDLAARRIERRDRHGAGRVHGGQPDQAAAAPRRLPRAAPQHQHQLGADPGPQSDLHRGRLLRGLRRHALDGVQSDRRHARARQRPAAAAQGGRAADGARCRTRARQRWDARPWPGA